MISFKKKLLSSEHRECEQSAGRAVLVGADGRQHGDPPDAASQRPHTAVSANHHHHAHTDGPGFRGDADTQPPHGADSATASPASATTATTTDATTPRYVAMMTFVLECCFTFFNDG